jgi:manganese/zinc/iron transport system permease protein
MMVNPYSGTNFFEFFAVLGKRILQFVTGHGSPLWADEVQLAVLACSAIACGLIGPFLVLKRMSMFANSLSHTTLLGVAGAFLFASHWWGSGMTDLTTLLLGACIAALLTAGLTEVLSRIFRLAPDASIGLSFTTLFAIGVIVVSVFTKDAHLSTEAVTGNCDALQLSDLRLAASIALLNIAFVSVFYRPLMLMSFDESFLRALGFSAPLWRFCLFFLTAFTVVGSFRAVGVLVVLALLMGPYLTVRLFCHRLTRLVVWAPLCGLGIVLLSVAMSRAMLSGFGVALSTGGILSLTTAVVFLGAALVRKLAVKINSSQAPGSCGKLE